MEGLMLRLPYPPTLNTMYPNLNKRRILSRRGKAYRAHVVAAVWEQHGLKEPLTGPLKMTVELTPPDNRRRDLDNLFKPVFDGLQHAMIFKDDSQIKQIVGIMNEKGKDDVAGCTVIVEEL